MGSNSHCILLYGTANQSILSNNLKTTLSGAGIYMFFGSNRNYIANNFFNITYNYGALSFYGGSNFNLVNNNTIKFHKIGYIDNKPYFLVVSRRSPESNPFPGDCPCNNQHNQP
jgi:hypothetical protein